MRHSLYMVLFLSATTGFAQSIRWADLVPGRTYKLEREIRLKQHKNEFSLSSDEELRLIDFKPLPMVNVHLAEFKLPACSQPEFVSEMILVEIEQPNRDPVAVGVDMVENCVLEIFIEKKDFNTLSIFK